MNPDKFISRIPAALDLIYEKGRKRPWPEEVKSRYWRDEGLIREVARLIIEDINRMETVDPPIEQEQSNSQGDGMADRYYPAYLEKLEREKREPPIEQEQSSSDFTEFKVKTPFAPPPDTFDVQVLGGTLPKEFDPFADPTKLLRDEFVAAEIVSALAQGKYALKDNDYRYFRMYTSDEMIKGLEKVGYTITQMDITGITYYKIQK